MAKNKHDKQKRSWGGAIKRTNPSAPSVIIDREIRSAILGKFCPEQPKILDYGCGHGFDADHYGWDSYDPYYRPNNKVEGPYDFVVCTNVLNVLSRNNRSKLLTKIKSLLTENGLAYLTVPRNIPVTGKLGIHHSLLNYVVFSTPKPGIMEDEMWRKHMFRYIEEPGEFVIYQMSKTSKFKDKTKEFMTARDKRAAK